MRRTYTRHDRSSNAYLHTLGEIAFKKKTYMKWFLLIVILLSIFTGCGRSDSSPSERGVYIDSVTANPTSQEQITLKNDADTEADISNWKLGDLNDPYAYNIPSGTIIFAQATHKFPRSTLGFQINDEGEIIYLRDNDGDIIDIWSN